MTPEQLKAERTQQAIDIFGKAALDAGLRHRGWWILETLNEDDINAGAQEGFLCVITRDGGSNPIDLESLRLPNCVGTSEDSLDCTYRYYYYAPLNHQAGVSR